MTATCGRCRQTIQPDARISVSGVGQRYYRCFNEEMSARLVVEWERAHLG
jgi:hypothetical protein